MKMRIAISKIGDVEFRAHIDYARAVGGKWVAEGIVPIEGPVFEFGVMPNDEDIELMNGRVIETIREYKDIVREGIATRKRVNEARIARNQLPLIFY